MQIKSIVVGSGPKLGGKQMSKKSVRLRVAPGVAVLDTAENPLTVMDYLAQEFEVVPNVELPTRPEWDEQARRDP